MPPSNDGARWPWKKPLTESTSPAAPAIPTWIVNRLAHFDLNRIDLNSGPIAKYFQHLANEGAPKVKAWRVVFVF